MLRNFNLFPIQADGSLVLLEYPDVRGITPQDSGAPVERVKTYGRLKVVTNELPETILVRTKTTVLWTPREKK